MKAGTYLHFLRHALQLRFDSSHLVPLSMNLHVTHRCCNRCVYCSYNREAPNLLTLEVLHRVFVEARKLGCRRVNLTGGEPLLRNDLNAIVAGAKQHGLYVSMATSGAPGVEAHLEAFKQCDQVMLSFDGPYDVRLALTGKLAADASERAVSVFEQEGISFWTTTVLTRRNVDQIDWIVDHAKKHGSQANFVLLETQDGNGLRFHPAPEDVRDLCLTDGEARAAIGHIIALKRAGAPIGSSLPYLEEWLRWPDYSRLQSVNRSSLYRECIALRATCELQADGRLDACSMAFAHTQGVSIFDAGFAAAFRRLCTKSACQSCVSSCMLESNLMFSLNPRTVWNWLERIR
ncbi:MAG: radical SAM protein [Lentisphaerae bacterium]|nr:radical SAM protein [Lentisphaerota bacterium]